MLKKRTAAKSAFDLAQEVQQIIDSQQPVLLESTSSRPKSKAGPQHNSDYREVQFHREEQSQDLLMQKYVQNKMADTREGRMLGSRECMRNTVQQLLRQQREKIERRGESKSWVVARKENPSFESKAKNLHKRLVDTRRQLLNRLVECGVQKILLTKGMIKMENKQKQKQENSYIASRNTRKSMLAELQKQLYKETIEQSLR